MSDDRPNEAAPEATPVEAGTPAAGERVAALEAEAGELKDRVLRSLAEMENLRRRTERDVRDARDYAVTAFARDVLSVADNLHRALEAATPEIRSAAGGFVAGIEVTERELLSALEKHGVKRLEPMGTRFDPNFHQAMFEIPNAEVAAGTVVQVLQPGYTLADRCLRPALVGVAKGGPRPQVAGAEPRASVDRTV